MKKLTTVKTWMTDLVIDIDADASVPEALALMRRRYTSSLIVRITPTNPQYGIITSSDICDKIIAKGVNPADLKVRDIMHSPVITVTEELSIQECAKLMMENHVHHMPVADDDGKIIGMISATDFLVVAEGLANNFADRKLN